MKKLMLAIILALSFSAIFAGTIEQSYTFNSYQTVRSGHLT